MTLFVDPLEGLWFLVNATALVVTVMSLLEGYRDYVVARSDVPSDRQAVRVLTARGNVRREFLRIVMQGLLISIVIPGLFQDRPTPLSPVVIALLLVPVSLLIQTVLDARLRGKLAEMLLAIVRYDQSQVAQEASVQQNIELVQHNIELTQEAAEHAKAAYHEANNVNVKIADLSQELVTLTKTVGGKEDKA